MAHSSKSGQSISAAIVAGTTSAIAETDAALARIAAENSSLGALTDVTASRARARALAIDRKRAAGETLGPLAGVPFAVKNLFDIAGLTTRAGSKINRTNPPASTDATAVARLEAAGAILVGACNMDEYAYGFTGENAHESPSRNPHDTSRMTGGSSGGSAAAVAGGLVSLALGSDTNGSIRVPASLCGLYGLKPTYGRLSRAGCFPFVASLDTIGPLSASLADLAACYDALQGGDAKDPVQSKRAADLIGDPTALAARPLRMARAGGYFRDGATAEVLGAVDAACAGSGIEQDVILPEAHRARAAAYVMTAAEGGALHLDRLKTRAADFDPDTRDRLIAGAMLPALWVLRAQKFRRWFNREVMRVFERVDVIVAPATPITAPRLGQKTFTLGASPPSGADAPPVATELPVRASLGLYTQPISFIGLPVVTVPLRRPAGALPIGVQLIAAPWNERAAFAAAARMQSAGLLAA